MEYFVYIIFSNSYNIYYNGFTTDPQKRLIQHNNNESRFTAGKGSWKLVYLEKFTSKKEALVKEKKLKRSNSSYIKWLIGQPINMLNE